MFAFLIFNSIVGGFDFTTPELLFSMDIDGAEDLSLVI